MGKVQPKRAKKLTTKKPSPGRSPVKKVTPQNTKRHR